MKKFVNNLTNPLPSSPDLFGGSKDGMDYPNKSGNDVVGFEVCDGSVG